MTNDLETKLLEITGIFARGEVDEAFARMAELEQSCRTDRERAQVMARYVTFFHLLELYDEELSALAQALILDPTNPRANYLNAVHLMADERWDDAIEALNMAARYYPPQDKTHLAEVYGNLSYCWEQQADRDRAEMYRSIAEQLDPEGVRAILGDEEAEWPTQLEPEEFEIPPDEVLDLLDRDDEDEQPAAARVERMVQELGGRRGRAGAGKGEPEAEGGRAEKAGRSGSSGKTRSAGGVGKPGGAKAGGAKAGGAKAGGANRAASSGGGAAGGARKAGGQGGRKKS